MNKFSVCAVLALSCSTAAFAQVDTLGNQYGPAHDGVSKSVQKMMLSNEAFVQKAATANLAEIELSNLALRKNGSPAIQSFAQRMQKDHTAAAKELQIAAKSKNLAVPTALDDAHKRIYEKLSNLTGTEFDKEYSAQMKEDHDKAVALFSAAAEDKSLDPQLQQFAAKTLPILRDHQQAAHSLLDEKASTTH